MRNLSNIALRNLRRYTRRSLLTISLIAFGVMFVVIFVAVTVSFKRLMITQITDSYMGSLQIHRRSYVASIESLPVNLNLTLAEVTAIEAALAAIPEIRASSQRLKFGGLFSNFVETTNIRLNGVDPAAEFATCPDLAARITQGEQGVRTLQRGTILVPELLARGFGTKVGDTVVVVATNKDGSVNGKTLVVSGILASVTGPGGRDGYVHIDDAMEILRMPEREVSEIAVWVQFLAQVDGVADHVRAVLAGIMPGTGRAGAEVHTWAQLSPFANIARMIDVMTFFIRLMLIAVVLISILNVMLMAVYERVREIGTIAAIGTLPHRILSLFLLEGFFLGVAGAVVGVLGGVGIIVVLHLVQLPVAMGQGTYLLAPTVEPLEVLTASLMVIVIAILASVQPAYKASRMEPIEALRHV
jgi:putative ABC transport system permease protein